MKTCQYFDGETVQDVAEIEAFLYEEWTRINQNSPLPEPEMDSFIIKSAQIYDEISMAYEQYYDAILVANNA